MKKVLRISVFLFLLSLGCWAGLRRFRTPWLGVDETVVGRFASQAGRPAWKPFINTDQGDLLLFVFLIAGACGGFVAGYYFRELFPPASKGHFTHD